MSKRPEVSSTAKNQEGNLAETLRGVSVGQQDFTLFAHVVQRDSLPEERANTRNILSSHFLPLKDLFRKSILRTVEGLECRRIELEGVKNLAHKSLILPSEYDRRPGFSEKPAYLRLGAWSASLNE